jgi:propanol-preferring alcohol dehydrogenase
VKALRLIAWQAEPELRDVPVPDPAPGEVLLEVLAAGLCHSDLHLMEWPEGTLPYELPFTLGHETVGRVAALGVGARGVDVGETVLVYGPWGCDRCWHCATGAVNLCERAAQARGHGSGMGYDGGLAEYVLVPSPRYLVPVDGLDPVRAAPLADAALTPYHAVKAALPLLRPGAEAVVIGAGGLGHVAVQLLAGLTPARVVAVDRRETALGLAREAGAHATVDTTAAAAADIRAELGRRGASLVLDFVGVDETLQLGASLLEEGGRLTIVGVGGGELPVSAYESPPMGSTVSTPNWGSLPVLLEVVELARAGLVDVHVEPVGLEDALDCYRRLRAGDVIGRAVVTANGG